MKTNEKIVIISTIGAEDAEKATLPFVMATAAQSMDVDVTMILQSHAVVVAKLGEAEKIIATGFMPLVELLKTFIELGGKLLLCSPCLKERGIQADELIIGSEIIAAGTVIDEVLSAKSVLSY